MTVRRTLSFDVSASQETAEFGEGQYLAVRVRALADGQSMYGDASKEDVFNAVQMLTQGAESGELEVFTCECGVAGCAGIFEDVVVKVAEQEVRWTFPQDPFRERLAPALVEGGPLVIAFDRNQYVQALSELTRQIDALTEGSEGVFNVLPCHHRIPETMGPSFSRYISECRVNAAEYAAHSAKLKAAEGALNDFALQTTLPNGIVLRTTLATLAYSLMPSGIEDTCGWLDGGMRERILANPVAALNDIVRTEWEYVFSVHAYPESAEKDLNADGWVERYGDQLTFTVVAAN